jgi:RNAse (barnase) inhibitor barstar
MQKIEKSNIPKSGKDLFVGELEGAHCTTLRMFYGEIAKTLSFPDFFGKNLDALADSLRSLDAIEQNEIVLVIKNHSRFLAEASPTKRKMVADIFEEVSKAEGRDDGKVFKVLGVA